MSSHPQNQSLSPSIPWLIFCVGTGWFLANVPILPGSPIFEFNFYYVIPAGSGITSARPPVDGYVLQESTNVIGATDTEVASYYSPTTVTLSNENQQRNFKFIAGANWSSNIANILTELPHGLKIGSEVEIKNIVSNT